MAFWCMCFMRDLMLDLEIFSLVNLLMECSCMAPLTPAVMVMMGLVCNPLFCRVLINGPYFMCFQVSACSGNLSWQYVNSINWSVRVEAIPSILLSACSFHVRSKWVSTNVRSVTMWHTIFNF
jgi:hypothetical protein